MNRILVVIRFISWVILFKTRASFFDRSPNSAREKTEDARSGVRSVYPSFSQAFRSSLAQPPGTGIVLKFNNAIANASNFAISNTSIDFLVRLGNLPNFWLSIMEMIDFPRERLRQRFILAPHRSSVVPHDAHVKLEQISSYPFQRSKK